MPIRSFEQSTPLIHSTAYVDETAVIIGDVEIGQDSSVWPLCVIRGDIQSIRIGARTSIQDGTIIHVTHDSRFCPGGQPTLIRNDVTVGHKVILHACTIEDYCLIGMGAILLDDVEVGSGSVVAAGALLPPGKKYPPNSLIKGAPAKAVRELTPEEQKQMIDTGWRNYDSYVAEYRKTFQISHP